MKRLTPIFYIVIGALGFASIVETRISVFAVLLLVIALASLSHTQIAKRKNWQFFLIASTIAAVIGTGRFVWQEALPGISEARGRASSKKAVSLLREIFFAQNAMRRYAMIDPDGDKIGSAGLLAELSGTVGARGGSVLPHPPLAPRFSPQIITNTGPATEQEGYLIIVCLPGVDKEWVAHPGEHVDDETAERRYVVYAWPSQSNLPHQAAYFIDEREGILESDNFFEQGQLRLVGSAASPSCDDALQEKTRAHWHAWEGKQPLPQVPDLPL